MNTKDSKIAEKDLLLNTYDHFAFVTSLVS